LTESLADVAVVGGLALHHEERWDGRGYPDGLSGSEIPAEAAILAARNLPGYTFIPPGEEARMLGALTIDALEASSVRQETAIEHLDVERIGDERTGELIEPLGTLSSHDAQAAFADLHREHGVIPRSGDARGHHIENWPTALEQLRTPSRSPRDRPRCLARSAVSPTGTTLAAKKIWCDCGDPCCIAINPKPLAASFEAFTGASGSTAK